MCVLNSVFLTYLLDFFLIIGALLYIRFAYSAYSGIMDSYSYLMNDYSKPLMYRVAMRLICVALSAIAAILWPISMSIVWLFR